LLGKYAGNESLLEEKGGKKKTFGSEVAKKKKLPALQVAAEPESGGKKQPSEFCGPKGERASMHRKKP